MSRQRNAEVAVIEQAREVVCATGAAAQMLAIGRLAGGLRLLDSMPLPKPHGVPTGANHPETSHMAAELLRPMVKRLSGQVLRTFLTVGQTGLTADAVQVRLRGTHQSVSPRVTELARNGWIVDTGQRRKTRSGRWAIVYRPTMKAVIAAQHIEEWTW
jgi:hypothetical protein